MDWNLWKQKIKDTVDDEIVGRLKVGGIVGIPATPDATREQARQYVPDLSSLNPSRIWSRSQQVAMGTEGTMEESVEYYENILLPAALDALKDQQGQLLANGKICQWPSSPFAASWVSWCVNNMDCTRTNLREQVYNLNGYNLWEIGEISSGIIQKRIAVNTTYKGGLEVKHYYPEKNWY